MDNKSRVFGIDVSKARLAIGDYEGAVRLNIDNVPTAIAQWLSGLAPGSIIAMEATGAYYQGLAALAHAAGMRVFVLNPRTLKHYAEAIGQRGKTDPIDARMIARYAMHEQAKLFAWEPPPAATDRLGQLLQRRERDQHGYRDRLHGRRWCEPHERHCNARERSHEKGRAAFHRFVIPHRREAMPPERRADERRRGIRQREQEQRYAVEHGVPRREQEHDGRRCDEAELSHRCAFDAAQCLSETSQHRHARMERDECERAERYHEDHGPLRLEQPGEAQRRQSHGDVQALAQHLGLQQRADDAEHRKQRGEGGKLSLIHI